MQVRVTIELEGDAEEVGRLVTQIGETVALSELEPEESQESADLAARVWWTPERAAAFVRELTPPALQAVSVIASHPPRLAFREFQRRMGMSGPQLAGRLSSIGFTVARQGTPFPFVRDYYQKVYRIDEEVAAVIGEAAAAEQARRRAEPRRGRSRAAAG